MDVTVQEAKTQLSKLLRRVEAGETIVIRRGKHRIAVLSKLPPSENVREIWGNLDGWIADDFDEPVDDFSDYAS